MLTKSKPNISHKITAITRKHLVDYFTWTQNYVSHPLFDFTSEVRGQTESVLSLAWSRRYFYGSHNVNWFILNHHWSINEHFLPCRLAVWFHYVTMWLCDRSKLLLSVEVKSIVSILFVIVAQCCLLTDFISFNDFICTFSYRRFAR